MLSIFIQSFAWFIFNSYLNFHLSRNKISFKFQIFLNMFAYFYYYVNTKEYFIYITYICLVWLIFLVYLTAYFWIISCPHCFVFYSNFLSLRRVRKESLCISDLLLRKVNGINYWVAQWLRMDFSSFTIFTVALLSEFIALRNIWPCLHLLDTLERVERGGKHRLGSDKILNRRSLSERDINDICE